jgi:hypothetical protein
MGSLGLCVLDLSRAGAIMVNVDIKAVCLQAIGKGTRILAKNFAAWHR